MHRALSTLTLKTEVKGHVAKLANTLKNDTANAHKMAK